MAGSGNSGWKKGFLGAGPTDSPSRSTQQQQPTANPHSELICQLVEEATRMLMSHQPAEAEVTCRRLLQLQNRILGSSHPDTMQSMQMLGMSLNNQDRREEAEQVFREVLQMRQQTLEIDHLSTLETASCLAQLLGSQGRHAEAEPMLRWVHRINVRNLGANHPETILGQITFAGSLHCLNRNAEAVELLLDVRHNHGSVVPEDLAEIVRFDLACCYNALGDFTRAELLLREGLMHEENGGSLQGRDIKGGIALQLGRCLTGKGDHAAAEPHFRKAVKQCRRLSGEKSHETIVAMQEHAQCLVMVGWGAEDSGINEMAIRRFGEAVIMARMTLQLSQEVLGASHECTLAAMGILSSTLVSHGRRELEKGRREQWQSKMQEAESTARDCVRALELSRGVDHPAMVQCLTLLDNILGDRGQLATGKERKQLRHRIEKIQRRSHGAPAKAQQQP